MKKVANYPVMPAREQIADQFEPHQRALELHEPLPQFELHGHQFAPAVGNPAAIVELVGLADGQSHGLGALRAAAFFERVDKAPQRGGGVLQVVGNFDGGVCNHCLDFGHPQAVFLQLGPANPKPLRADAFDLEQAALR